MGFRSRKGSGQVEAAMVLPLVILAVLTTIWLLTVFYSQSASRSSIHLALRSSAGIYSNTVLSPGEEGFGGLYDSILRAGEMEELMEAQAEKRLSVLPGAGGQAKLEGHYNTVSLPPVLRLSFEKRYSPRGLNSEEIDAAGSGWYFNIDEAQWIRNEDWVREALAKREGKKIEEKH